MKRFFFAFTPLCVATILLLNSCANKQNAGNVAAVATGPVNGAKIAYVNIDTLEAHFEFLKSKKEDFKKRQQRDENELQQSYMQMQKKGEDLQKRVQERSISENEYKSIEKQLIQMQQTLEGRRQSLTEQLMKEQQEFNMDLKKRLDLFLDNYNKDKHFDYILSYKADGSSPVMYANKQFDITAEVTAGINAAVKTDKKQP